jgi:hypothetical protein
VLDLIARSPRAVILVTHTPEALDERWRVFALSSGVAR